MTTNDNIVQIVERNRRKLDGLLRKKLLRRREELAAAAVTHTSHGLLGAGLLWRCVHEVDERLRTLFPSFWEAHYREWVAADAARLHSEVRPQPSDCDVCAERATRAVAPSRAS